MMEAIQDMYEKYQNCKKQVQYVDDKYGKSPFMDISDWMRRYSMAESPKEIEEVENQMPKEELLVKRRVSLQ
ncbi:unnamed protein product [Anisakis simplex]|uniref:Phage protein n=1 Tax=Anisakis simplex TaxID=6269 RepID=A0A0M3KKM1_ANISI|nr:unnamed protein product [Anisakis simplex]